MIYAAGVLAGAYKGRDIGVRDLLSHAVSDVPIEFGRLKRNEGEAFCNRSIDVVDSGDWKSGLEISCARCQKIVDRMTRQDLCK
jgi:hypothetical protein